MIDGILKIARLELKRSSLTYDRRVMMIFLPSLVLIMVFFFFFLQSGQLFENKFYTVASSDGVLDPIVGSNPKLVLVPEGMQDLWLRTGDGVIMQIRSPLRSKAAAESFMKSLKEYNRLVFSTYPDVIEYPVWVRTVYLERNISADQPVIASLANYTGGETQEPGEGVEESAEGAAGEGGVDAAYADAALVVRDSYKDKIIVDSAAFSEDNQVVEENDTTEKDGYVTPGKLSPAVPFEPIYLALSTIVVFTFVALLYSNRMYDEKVNKKGSLLLITPLSTGEIIIGKTLPHLAAAMILSLAVALLKTQDLVSIALLSVIVFAISLVYLSIAFLVSLLSRSFKELSFLGIFSVSMYSMFLLIPAFLIGLSEASYASPLTVVVKLLLGEPVEADLFVFTLVPHLLLAVLIFYIGGLIFTSESLFSYKSIPSKIIDTYDNFLRRPSDLIYSSMAVVPFVFLAELMLVVVLVSINIREAPFYVLFLAAFVEESFKALGIYAVYSRRLFPVDLGGAVRLGLYTGFGFFLAEKIMLLIVIATFIGGYNLIVLVGLLIPLLLHCTISVLFSLGLYLIGYKRVLAVLTAVALLHFGFNLAINLLLI